MREGQTTFTYQPWSLCFAITEVVARLTIPRTTRKRKVKKSSAFYGSYHVGVAGAEPWLEPSRALAGLGLASFPPKSPESPFLPFKCSIFEQNPLIFD